MNKEYDKYINEKKLSLKEISDLHNDVIETLQLNLELYPSKSEAIMSNFKRYLRIIGEDSTDLDILSVEQLDISNTDDIQIDLGNLKGETTMQSNANEILDSIMSQAASNKLTLGLENIEAGSGLPVEIIDQENMDRINQLADQISGNQTVGRNAVINKYHVTTLSKQEMFGKYAGKDKGLLPKDTQEDIDRKISENGWLLVTHNMPSAEKAAAEKQFKEFKETLAKKVPVQAYIPEKDFARIIGFEIAYIKEGDSQAKGHIVTNQNLFSVLLFELGGKIPTTNGPGMRVMTVKQKKGEPKKNSEALSAKRISKAKIRDYYPEKVQATFEVVKDEKGKDKVVKCMVPLDLSFTYYTAATKTEFQNGNEVKTTVYNKKVYRARGEGEKPVLKRLPQFQEAYGDINVKGEIAAYDSPEQLAMYRDLMSAALQSIVAGENNNLTLPDEIKGLVKGIKENMSKKHEAEAAALDSAF